MVQEDTSPDARRETERPESTSDYDELAQRLKGLEGVSEDTAMLIAQNWKKLLTMLAVVLLVVFVIGEAKASRRKKLEEAAVRLTSAQGLFKEVLGVDGASPENVGEKEKSEDAPKTFDDNLRLLVGSGSDLYRSLGELYLAAAELGKHNIDGAKKELERFDINIYADVKTAVSGRKLDENLLDDELAALLYARVLVAEGKEAKARQRLRTLALGGSFSNVEALVALVRLSQSAQARLEAQKVAKEVLKARPELGDLIRSELSVVGMAIEEEPS